MRCIRLFLFCTFILPLLLHAAQADDTRDYKQAEKLAWEEKYDAAIAMMTPLPISASDRYYARQVLCLTYSLWGKNEEAMAECSRALENPAYKTALECIEKEREENRLAPNTRKCGPSALFSEMLGVHSWAVLARYRLDPGRHQLWMGGAIYDTRNIARAGGI